MSSNSEVKQSISYWESGAEKCYVDYKFNRCWSVICVITCHILFVIANIVVSWRDRIQRYSFFSFLRLYKCWETWTFIIYFRYMEYGFTKDSILFTFTKSLPRPKIEQSLPSPTAVGSPGMFSSGRRRRALDGVAQDILDGLPFSLWRRPFKWVAFSLTCLFMSPLDVGAIDYWMRAWGMPRMREASAIWAFLVSVAVKFLLMPATS